MDIWNNLALGFGIALSWSNLAWCLAGAAAGTAVGVLPGLGPLATIALLLPATFALEPTQAIIVLSGIYYGAMYGGSITAVLVNIPGEAASVVTCIDGHMMARKGRAGAALGIAAFGSFFAGIVSVIGLALVGPTIARVALDFGPVEYSALLILGLILVSQVSNGSAPVKNAIMVLLGLLLATVGLDPIYGSERYTFGATPLLDGLDVALLAMGLFGLGELLTVIDRPEAKADLVRGPDKLSELLPNAAEWRASALPIFRGTILGFFLGLLPGSGAILSSFASYVLEKKLSRDPSRFGKGAIEGVAGPETANNAAAQASFAPLLSLGIPANPVLGVMLGALMIHGIAPGPTFPEKQPELFWGVIASMFIGNVILVVLNVPLIGIFIRLLSLPFKYLGPIIICTVILGTYSLNNSFSDLTIVVLFGLFGWGLRRTGFDPAPLILSFVIGGLLERSIRQALILGDGSPAIFLEKPLSLALLATATMILLWSVRSVARRVLLGWRSGTGIEAGG